MDADKVEALTDRFGCGYFLATGKVLKNQAILHSIIAEMVEKSRVIEVEAAYPRV